MIILVLQRSSPRVAVLVGGQVPRTARVVACILLPLLALLVVPRAARAETDRGADARAVVKAVGDMLERNPTPSCELRRLDDGGLEARCRVPGFPTARYCQADLPLAHSGPIVGFFARFVAAVVEQSPPNRVLDYEVNLKGFSDGLDFSGPVFDKVYQCEKVLDFGQGAIGDAILDLHARLGSFRALTIWLMFHREAENRQFPFLFPRPPGSGVEAAPGRVVLAHSRADAVGDQHRRVEVSIRVFPRLVLRCPQGTHTAVVMGYETCLPDCPMGTVAHAVAGTVTCLPLCKANEELIIEPGTAPRCTARRPCGEAVTAMRAEPLVNIGNVHLGIGLSASFLGGNGFYGERVLAELTAAGQTLAWHVGFGGVVKHTDSAFGMAVVAGLRVGGWEKPALYPRVAASFMNFSGHRGGADWQPFWLIAGEPGLDWHFYQFNHGALVASIFAMLGVRVQDDQHVVAATLATDTTTRFAYGGGLELGLLLW